MAYGERQGGGGPQSRIRTFWPDDTEDTFYHADGRGLDELFERCQVKWPGITMAEIHISPEYIHTDCLGYGEYFPSDYTKFLCITASDEYFKRMERTQSEKDLHG